MGDQYLVDQLCGGFDSGFYLLCVLFCICFVVLFVDIVDVDFGFVVVIQFCGEVWFDGVGN